jgi:ABC-type nitrate/sulfonate/bicarbonate transport system substrate-binding protein
MRLRFPRRRRGWLAVAAVALAIGALASTASASTRASAGSARPAAGRTLTFGVQQGYSLLPVFAAIRQGYFKKVGITDVKLNIFSSTPAMFAAAAQGQIDLAQQSIPGIVNYNTATSGTKLKIVAVDTFDSTMMFARTGSGIPAATAKDWKSTVRSWKGKKIGIPVQKGLQQLYIDAMLKEVGMSPSDINYLVVGVGAPAVAAMRAGLVDTISGDVLTLGLIRPEKLGYAMISFPAHQAPPVLLNQPTGVFFTSEASASNDRALFAGFANGIVKARAFLRNPKNKRSVIDLMVRKIGLKPEEANVIYPIGIPVFTKSKISKSIFDRTIAAYVQTGVLSGAAANPPPTFQGTVFDFAK